MFNMCSIMPCFKSISVYFYYIHLITTTITFPKDFKRQENLNFEHVLAFNIWSKPSIYHNRFFAFYSLEL